MEVVSHVFESSSSSAVSVRSGSRIDSTWISRDSVVSVVQFIRSFVVEVPVLCTSFPLWKTSVRVRARAWSSSTAVGCVRVQMNECVDRRPSCGLVGLCAGAMSARSSAATSMFFAQSVRWAVCVAFALVVLMVACGHLVCRASRL